MSEDTSKTAADSAATDATNPEDGHKAKCGHGHHGHGHGCRHGNTLGMVYGAWLLRAWIGVRAAQTGIEKWAGIKGVDKRIIIDGKPSTYGLEALDMDKMYDATQYEGVPSSMMEAFQKEPLMPDWALPLFDKAVGPVLLALGAAILLGILPRTSLFLLGLFYVSLTWGLILLNQDPGIAWLGTHMILIVMALALAKHNRLCLIGKL